MTIALSAIAAAGQDFTEQAPVTQWGLRLALTLAVIATIALAVWGMRRSWLGRADRQGGMPAPQARPASLGHVRVESCPGRYVATATAGDWLDRIVAHDLGAPSRAELTVTSAGVLVDKDTGSFWIPAKDILSVRLGQGIAQQVFESNGLVLITWQLGDATLETGFRADSVTDHVAVVRSISEFQPTPGGAS